MRRKSPFFYWLTLQNRIFNMNEFSIAMMFDCNDFDCNDFDNNSE